jgi:hypothetical protein
MTFFKFPFEGNERDSEKLLLSLWRNNKKEYTQTFKNYQRSDDVMDVIWLCLNQINEKINYTHIMNHPYIRNAPASLSEEALYEIG